MSNIQVHEQFSLTPKTFDEAMKYAELIANSDLAPKDYKGKPGNVMVALQMGAEVGLKPLQALQNIAVINGRPCVWGDAMLAICRASADFEDIQEFEKDGTAYCVVKRRGQSIIERKFGDADAAKAGLANKQGPWTQYPSRMKQMRARAFALRDAFSDTLKGLSSAEEVQDYRDEKDITPTRTASALKDLGIAAKPVIQHESARQEQKQESNEMQPAEQEELVNSILNSMQAAETVEELTDYLKEAAKPLTGKYRQSVVAEYKAKKKSLEEIRNPLDASWEEFKKEEVSQ